MARRAAALALVALAFAATAWASTAPTAPVYDGEGRLVETPLVPAAGTPRLTEDGVEARFLRHPKVARWLDRYPPQPTADADFDAAAGSWRVRVWSGPAGQVAEGRVDDLTGQVREAWTGPQVAWKMARGAGGAFGGETINDPWVWGAFCLVFALGLGELRRPLSLRNLDLLVLLSFSVSLWFFNEGEILWSVPLAYPPLAYVLGRMAWIGWRGRARPARPVWPVWVLAAAAVFLGGFRIGLNLEAPRSVIDVGYAGVIGAQRIVNGQAPYGHMPVQESRPACGPADAAGEVRERIQENGRCESSNPRGDTYGPVSYAAYVPGYLAFGWSGKWDRLPAAHATSLLFDTLALAGLVLVGRRFGGARLATTLAFAWAAYPFTQYASNSNTNDAIMPALLIWGFWLLTKPGARGAFVALAGWTKFGALLLAPLWLGYPSGLRSPGKRRFAAAFALATAAAFSILLLEPDPLHALRVFYDRTVGFQLERGSPFSIWDWGSYHGRGLPDLHVAQQVLEGLLLAAALLLAVRPRRRTPLRLAALTAALLAGFQLVLTHWFYLYLPWFLPFVAFALFAPGEEEEHGLEPDALAASS
ncbi:MAG: hypothetical protein HY511_09035 [Actinobacteria bacterium]|nr:hypothetical protein [Actinomycetota bacterium]